MEPRIEAIILRELVNNEHFRDTMFHHLTADLFDDSTEKAIFTQIANTVDKKQEPSFLQIRCDINKLLSKGNDTEERLKYIDMLESSEDAINDGWLADKTKTFVNNARSSNALLAAAEEMEKAKIENRAIDVSVFAQQLAEAQRPISDDMVGVSLCDDIDSFFDDLHDDSERIPFNLDFLNEATRGGLKRKELGIVQAATGVGKSLFLCDHAAHLFRTGRRVLYITLEMSETVVRQRIYQNLLSLTLDELAALEKPDLKQRVENLHKRTVGDIVVKEFPTGSSHVGHFNELVKKLNAQRNFVPDVIIVDYLTICRARSTSRSGNIHGYEIINAVAQELRSLAVENDCLVFTAAQTNKDARESLKPGTQHTAGSYGINSIADFVISLGENEANQQMGRQVISIAKNRNGSLGFVQVAVDKARMTIKALLDDETPKTSFGNGRKPKRPEDKKDERFGSSLSWETSPVQ